MEGYKINTTTRSCNYPNKSKTWFEYVLEKSISMNNLRLKVDKNDIELKQNPREMLSVEFSINVDNTNEYIPYIYSLIIPPTTKFVPPTSPT